MARSRRVSPGFSAWTNHAPASPRYSTSFPQVLACLFYRCACFLRALCVRACIALPCRSRLTVIQLANVHHVSRVDDFVLVVRCGSNCTSCGSRLTFSQIWRVSPSRWRVNIFIRTCISTFDPCFGTVLIVDCPFARLCLMFLIRIVNVVLRTPPSSNHVGAPYREFARGLCNAEFAS